jgi:hypothetical protein
MKLLTILLVTFITFHSKSQTVYFGNSKELLEEKVDVHSIANELTDRVYKISEELKRFEYSKFNSLQSTEDINIQTSAGSVKSDDKLAIYSRRKRVSILPFISLEEANASPESWVGSIEKAKNTDAHFIIRGVIESAKAEPKLTGDGSQGSVKTYAGFEGSISFKIQIYDLEQDIELEESKLSDRGLLKSHVIKGATGVLNVGSRLVGKGDLGHATKTNVNSLVDQSLPNTKQEAINEAINRSEKYLRQLFSETFPMYFPLLSLTENTKDGIELKFLNVSLRRTAS